MFEHDANELPEPITAGKSRAPTESSDSQSTNAIANAGRTKAGPHQADSTEAGLIFAALNNDKTKRSSTEKTSAGLSQIVIVPTPITDQSIIHRKKYDSLPSTDATAALPASEHPPIASLSTTAADSFTLAPISSGSGSHRGSTSRRRNIAGNLRRSDGSNSESKQTKHFDSPGPAANDPKLVAQNLAAQIPTGPLDSQPTVIRKLPLNSLPPAVGHLHPTEMGRVLLGQTLGHYELLEFVGGGGMGAVFRSLDAMLNRIVAVKVLSQDQSSDEETLRRFKNEAQSAARLDHENIGRVHYVGEDGGWHYIVFEFIDGINLRDLVDRDGPLSIVDAVSYLLQLGDALEHASQRDVVHRDIKPSNVLITPESKAKLVDMGLARLHQVEHGNNDLTASGVTLGTFDYISPEQARDPRIADVRSDMYSLGCTLYFMLSGRPPFPTGTVLQKLLQHQGDEPPDVRQFCPQLPADLERILKRLLAKSPEDRYQRPSELVDEVSAIAVRLGLRPAVPGGRVWEPNATVASYWERNIPWLVPVGVLVALVLALNNFWAPVNETVVPPLLGRLPRPIVAEPPSNAPATIGPRTSTSRNGTGKSLDASQSTTGNVGSTAIAGSANSDTTNDHADPKSDSIDRQATNRQATPRQTTDVRAPDARSNLPGKNDPALVGNSSGSVVSGSAVTGSAVPSNALRNVPNWLRSRVPLGREMVTSVWDSLQPEQLTSVWSTIRDAVPTTAIEPAGPASKAPRADATTTDAIGSAIAGRSASRITTVDPARRGELVVSGASVRTTVDGSATYRTLASALRDAKSGDVIELRVNGILDEAPIELSNTKLTLRAGEGFQPLVRFRPAKGETERRAMVTVTGGQLTLHNLHVEFEVPREMPADRWALFEMNHAEALRLQGCTITVRSAAEPLAYRPSVAIVDVKAGLSAVGSAVRDNPMPRKLVAIEVKHSLIRGEATFLRSSESEPIDLLFENSLLVTSERFVDINVGHSSNVGQSEPRPMLGNRIEIRHATLVTHGGLVRLTDDDSATTLMPTEVNCIDSIVAGNRTAPLVEQSADDRIDDTRKRLVWTGDRNFYESFAVFWKVSDRTSGEEHNFKQWQSTWGERENMTSTQPVGWIRFPATGRALHTLVPTDFALRNLDNPARSAASDRLDAGCTVELLPRPPERSAALSP